jgi:uncharacterized alkaline shock family protein YloU
MAENKYISQAQENGNVKISEDVIFTIADHAIHEVEGFVALSTKPGADIADKIGKKNWGKGMKITIGEDSTLSVECNVIIAYGQSVVAVANAIQDALTSALESMTGVKVSCVNVNICGIAQK